MSTYLLVHGAWHGGWCWRKVVPLLEAQGHKVLAPTLPGHGEDKTPAAAVTLRSYADTICRLAGAQTKPVILVGHSMGGIVITQAAENAQIALRHWCICVLSCRGPETRWRRGPRRIERVW